MGINKFNAEGYYDPTAYEAMTNIIKEEKRSSHSDLLCISAHPMPEMWRQTSRRHKDTADSPWTAAISPSLRICCFRSSWMTAILKERELAMFFGNVLMSKCAELWVFGDLISSGMAAEIDRAKRKNYAIRYFNSDLKEVTQNA